MSGIQKFRTHLAAFYMWKTIKKVIPIVISFVYLSSTSVSPMWKFHLLHTRILFLYSVVYICIISF